MADEPENLVLVHLREIRREIGGMRENLEARIDRLETRFDSLDKQFGEMRQYVSHALGLGAMNDIKGRELQARIDADAHERRKSDRRVEELERRVTRLEERIDS